MSCNGVAVSCFAHWKSYKIETSQCISENIHENNNLNWNVSGVASIETCKWWKETGNLREVKKT